MTAVDPMVIEELGSAHPLARHIGDFLTDLANAAASAHTLRAYRGDLAQFAAHHDGEIGSLDAATIRAYLADAAWRRSYRHPQLVRPVLLESHAQGNMN